MERLRTKGAGGGSEEAYDSIHHGGVQEGGHVLEGSYEEFGSELDSSREGLKSVLDGPQLQD